MSFMGAPSPSPFAGSVQVSKCLSIGLCRRWSVVAACLRIVCSHPARSSSSSVSNFFMVLVSPHCAQNHNSADDPKPDEYGRSDPRRRRNSGLSDLSRFLCSMLDRVGRALRLVERVHLRIGRRRLRRGAARPLAPVGLPLVAKLELEGGGPPPPVLQRVESHVAHEVDRVVGIVPALLASSFLDERRKVRRKRVRLVAELPEGLRVRVLPGLAACERLHELGVVVLADAHKVGELSPRLLSQDRLTRAHVHKLQEGRVLEHGQAPPELVPLSVEVLVERLRVEGMPVGEELGPLALVAGPGAAATMPGQKAPAHLALAPSELRRSHARAPLPIDAKTSPATPAQATTTAPLERLRGSCGIGGISGWTTSGGRSAARLGSGDGFTWPFAPSEDVTVGGGNAKESSGKGLTATPPEGWISK